MKNRLIAYSRQFGKIVIATTGPKALADLNRIISEGDYNRDDLIIGQRFDNSDIWTPERLATASQTFFINSTLGVLT